MAAFERRFLFLASKAYIMMEFISDTTTEDKIRLNKLLWLRHFIRMGEDDPGQNVYNTLLYRSGRQADIKLVDLELKPEYLQFLFKQA